MADDIERTEGAPAVGGRGHGRHDGHDGHGGDYGPGERPERHGRSDGRDRTEVHEIARGDGKVTVEVTYTPRGAGTRGRVLPMHRLRMKVVAAEECSPNVFVYRRSTQGAPMEDGSPRDEFICVADELDEDEIPVNEPDMARNVPYYRVDSVELLFRNPDLMYETARAIMESIVR